MMTDVWCGGDSSLTSVPDGFEDSMDGFWYSPIFEWDPAEFLAIQPVKQYAAFWRGK